MGRASSGSGSGAGAGAGAVSLLQQIVDAIKENGAQAQAAAGAAALASVGARANAPAGSGPLPPTGPAPLDPAGSTAPAPRGSTSPAPTGSTPLDPAGSTALQPDANAPKPPPTLKDLALDSAKKFSTGVMAFTGQAEVDDYRIGQMSRRHLDNDNESIQSYRQRVRDINIGTGMSHDQVFQYAQTAGRYGQGTFNSARGPTDTTTGKVGTFDSLTQATTSAKMAFGLGADAEKYNDTLASFGHAGSVGASGKAGGFGQDQKQFAVTIAETLASGKLMDRLDDVLSSMTNLAGHIASRGGDVDANILGRALASANNTAKEFGSAKLQERAPDLLSKIDQTTSNLVNDPAAFAVYNRMHPSAAGNVGIRDMREFRKTMEGGDIIEKSKVYGGLYELHGGNLANLKPGGKLTDQDMIAQQKLSSDYGMTTEDYENTLKIAGGVSSGQGLQKLDSIQKSADYQKLTKIGSAGAISTYASLGTAENKEDLSSTLSKLITNVKETPGFTNASSRIVGSALTKESAFGDKLIAAQDSLKSGGDTETVRKTVMDLIAANENDTSGGKINLDVGNRLEQSKVQTTELNEAFMTLAGNVNQLNALLNVDHIKATAMRAASGASVSDIADPTKARTIGTGANEGQRQLSAATVVAVDKGSHIMDTANAVISAVGSIGSATALLPTLAKALPAQVKALPTKIGPAIRGAASSNLATGGAVLAAGYGLYSDFKEGGNFAKLKRESDPDVTYTDTKSGKATDGSLSDLISSGGSSWKGFLSKHEGAVKLGSQVLGGIGGFMLGGPVGAAAGFGGAGMAADALYEGLGINDVKRTHSDGSNVGGGEDLEAGKATGATVTTDTGIVSIQQTLVAEMRVAKLIIEGIENSGSSGGGYSASSSGDYSSSPSGSVTPPSGAGRVSGPGTPAGTSPTQYSAQYANWRKATGQSDEDLNKLVDNAANEYSGQGVTRDLLFSMMSSESGFDPNAKSGAGAEGLMQLMPQYHKGVNAFNPAEALMAGAKHIAGNLSENKGDMEAALAAYNGGQGNVNLPEARGYARKIMDRMGGTSTPSGGQRTAVAGPIAGVEGSDWKVGTAFMKDANAPGAAAYHEATGNAYNWGVDLVAAKGQKLTAQAAIGGTISKIYDKAKDVESGIKAGQAYGDSMENSGWGNQVEIKADDGTVQRMSHLAFVQSGLKVGQRIEAGATLGQVGATGRATGAHLDWEVIKGLKSDGKENKIDAMEWLHNAQANGVQIATGGAALNPSSASSGGSSGGGSQRLEIQIKLSQDKDGNITGKVEGSTSININFGGGDPIQRAAAAQARSGMPSGHVRTT